MAEAIGQAILGPLGLSTFGNIGFLGTSVNAVVGTVVIAATNLAVNSAVQRHMEAQAKRKMLEATKGYLLNTIEPTSNQQFVYGKIRKGGAITFQESTGVENKFLHMIICLAGHEVNAIKNIYLNEKDCGLDSVSNGFITAHGYNSKVYIRKFLGADNQDVYSTINSDNNLSGTGGKPEYEVSSGVAASNTEKTNFKGQGIACLYVRFEYDRDVFTEGLPTVTAIIEGKKVYDPRKDSTSEGYDSSLGVSSHRSGISSTWQYSANAALCVRDYIQASYGLDDGSYIDDVAFSVAATVCDASTALADSGNEAQYEINGANIMGAVPSDILRSMMQACGGMLYWSQGFWGLKAGSYSAPIRNFTLEDVRSDINIVSKQSRRDNFNVVQGTFADAKDNLYVTQEFPSIRSTTFIANDGGQENVFDIDFNFVTSSSQAQRLAKQILFRQREEFVIEAEFSLKALDLRVSDVISFTDSRYGFSNKPFEVISYGLVNNSDAGDLRVALTLRETSSAAYSWSAEETAITANNSTLANYKDNITPTNLSVSDVGGLQADQTLIRLMRASFTPADNIFIDRYVVDYAFSGSTAYTSHILRPDQSSVDLGPVQAGQQYTIRVRAFTSAGNSHTPVSVNHTPAGDTTAPSQPSAPTLSAGIRQIEVKWDNYAFPTDFAYMEIHSSTSASFTAQVPPSYSYQNSNTFIGRTDGTSFIHAGLSGGSTHYYQIRAVDLSGNASAISAEASGSVLADDAVGEFLPPELTDLTYDNLEQSLLVSDSGEWKIHTSSSGTASSTGTVDWTTSVVRLLLYTNDTNGRDQARFLNTVKSGDFITFRTSANANASAIFKLSSVPTENNNVWTFDGTTTSATNTSGLSATDGVPVTFSFSRNSNPQVQLNTGQKIPIDNDPAGNNNSGFVSATPTGTDGGNNSNLSRAFLNQNTYLASMDEIPDKTRIWAQFYLETDANNSTYHSYRLWQTDSQTWSSHATSFTDDLVFIDSMIADSVIADRADLIFLNIDNITIDKSIELENGAAWRVGDKQSPAETEKNGLFLGDPESLEDQFAFATTGGVTLDSNNQPVTTNSHGVLFTKSETKLINPQIQIGNQTTTTPVTINAPSAATIDHGTASNRVTTGSFTVNANVSTLYVNGVAGGGGGMGAQGSSTSSNRAGVATSFTLRHASITQPLATESASGGAAGTGTGVHKTDGDAGENSSYASGGAGGGGNQDGGNGSLGSGGGGGGGRDASAWTSSRKGGGGGSAGQSFSRTIDITALKAANNISSSATLILEWSVGSGGNYSGEVSYGEGGFGGDGFLTYRTDTTGLEAASLLTQSAQNEGFIGKNQDYVNASGFVLNTVYLNNTGQPSFINLHIQVGSAHGSSVHLDISDNANMSNYKTGCTVIDDDKYNNVTGIVPSGKYYRIRSASGAGSASGSYYFELRV